MTKEEYILLFEKFNTGICSEAEIIQLLEYKDDFDVFDCDWKSAMGDKGITREKILNKLKGKIVQPTKTKPFNLKFTLSIAATLIVFLSVCLIIFVPDKDKAVVAQKKEMILPGQDKAILKMANGSKIILEDIKKGNTVNYGNLSVTKTKSGEIIYKVKANKLNEESNEFGFNEILTPTGGQFSIVLEDGTKVWLNASSELRFPTKFANSQRRVDLIGEGYFEVAKDRSKPFIVDANNSTIKVLGTHFNISNYPEDNIVKTTLLEGSVEFSSNGNKALLLPNQEAVYSSRKSIFKVNNVINAQDAIAWKEGMFVFTDENIQSIMNKLSRWYGVEVFYDERTLNEEFSGSISKYENINKVLKKLELTGAVKFKIKERSIYVMK